MRHSRIVYQVRRLLVLGTLSGNLSSVVTALLILTGEDISSPVKEPRAVAAYTAMDAQNHPVRKNFGMNATVIPSKEVYHSSLSNLAPAHSRSWFMELEKPPKTCGGSARPRAARPFTPDLNQWVDVSSAVGAYKVKLTEEMMSGVVFRKVRTRWPWHFLVCLSFLDICGETPIEQRTWPFLQLGSCDEAERVNFSGAARTTVKR
jgi:hypothetical protein